MRGNERTEIAGMSGGDAMSLLSSPRKRGPIFQRTVVMGSRLRGNDTEMTAAKLRRNARRREPPENRLVPQGGFEPSTYRLRSDCSAVELLRRPERAFYQTSIKQAARCRRDASLSSPRKRGPITTALEYGSPLSRGRQQRCDQGCHGINHAAALVSPAGLTRGSICFAKTFCKTDGLPGQARQ